MDAPAKVRSRIRTRRSGLRENGRIQSTRLHGAVFVFLVKAYLFLGGALLTISSCLIPRAPPANGPSFLMGTQGEHFKGSRQPCRTSHRRREHPVLAAASRP